MKKITLIGLVIFVLLLFVVPFVNASAYVTATLTSTQLNTTIDSDMVMKAAVFRYSMFLAPIIIFIGLLIAVISIIRYLAVDQEKKGRLKKKILIYIVIAVLLMLLGYFIRPIMISILTPLHSSIDNESILQSQNNSLVKESSDPVDKNSDLGKESRTTELKVAAASASQSLGGRALRLCDAESVERYTEIAANK